MSNPSTPFTLPQLGPPNLANGDSGAGGQNDWASYQQMRPYLRNMLTSYYDVRMYGASPLATPSQNQVAFQLAAFDAAMSGVGGVLYIPTGRYALMPIATNGSGGATLAALCIPGGVTVHGDGPNASVLVMAANAPNQSYLLHNYTVGVSGGDTDITLFGLGIDGNAANQAGTTDAQYGCRFFKARRIKIIDCVFKDIAGTTSGALGPNGTPGEGFAQQFDNSADCTVMYSTAYATSANTSSGFASNQSTNVVRIGCRSYGWNKSMGFTDFQSANVAHSACQSYLNGTNGFNLEQSQNSTYEGCTAGGIATAFGAFPFTNSQSLGNTGRGFSFSASANIRVEGCTGSNNGQSGLRHYNNTIAPGQCRVWGGDFSNNGTYGFELDGNTKRLLHIAGRPTCIGNGTAAVNTGDTPATMTNLEGAQTAPAIPATGVAQPNPFPCAMIVRPAGGTITSVQIGPNTAGSGATVGNATDQRYLVPSGWFITLNYSVVPASWVWMAEPI